jgi:hypothetical protein
MGRQVPLAAVVSAVFAAWAGCDAKDDDSALDGTDSETVVDDTGATTTPAGNLRMIRRSSIAGFDYNTTSRSIGFFAESRTDTYNSVSEDKDAKVFISYLVWQRQCGEDCPLGDVCAIYLYLQRDDARVLHAGSHLHLPARTSLSSRLRSLRGLRSFDQHL